MKYLLVLTLLLVGCQQSTSTTQAVSRASGTPVWVGSEAGFAAPGAACGATYCWAVANTYQCGSPVQNGTKFYFDLKINGTSCGRNQLVPEASSGDVIRLAEGQTYTWTFRYIDGNQSDQPPGMGLDTGPDPESNVWQIHGYDEMDSPCTGLSFVNGAYYPGQPDGQEWTLSTCNGNVWFGPYTPQEKDNWKVVATISKDNALGETKLYRNGVLQVDDHGANYHNSTGDPWWNYGIYKWRWEQPGGGGSNMTEVQMTVNNMTLSQD